jgi:hypothetical protein
MTKIEKVLAECQRRLDEMRCPLSAIDIEDAYNHIEEEERLEFLEEQNRYHGTYDWEYDTDPNEF